MIKYKRRSINQKPELHDKEFIVYEEVKDMLDTVVAVAIKAGADEAKMMEFFNDDKA